MNANLEDLHFPSERDDRKKQLLSQRRDFSRRKETKQRRFDADDGVTL